MAIAENIAGVWERIALAARRARRQPEEVVLLAVTKTVPPEPIREAYRVGLRLFGENRVQDFSQKAAGLRDLADAEWHMIGHLQTNKAAKAAELFVAVDSIDSLRVAEILNSASEKLNKKLAVLIEINLGGEISKSGVGPESAQLAEILGAAPRLSQLEFRGLMAVPPFTNDPENARPFFRRLRQTLDQIAARRLPSVRMDILSMGMSHDFEVAIEEGSTCVRVGTAIFGERTSL